MSEKYHPLPQPDEIPQKERDDAMGGYLMVFAAWAIGLPLPVINLIAGLVYYFVNKNKTRFIRFHTFQAVISQVPTTLMNMISASLFISYLLSGTVEDIWYSNAWWAWVITVVVANLTYLVMSIYAATKAYNGRIYYIRLFGRLAYHHVYKLRPEELNPALKPTQVNQPPQ